MLVYGFHATTGEFTGEVMTEQDQLGGGQLAPWNTTSVPPPAAGPHQKPVFAAGAWSLSADYRGEIWYDGRVPVTIQALGEPVGLTRAPAPLSVEEQWAAVRAQRDARLAASDWTQIADAPLSAPAVEAWRAYRQALRDIPGTFNNPSNVIWPETP